MKDSKDNIDELIKQALTEEESEYLEKMGEQTLMEEGLDLFKGRRGWISIWIGFVIFVVFIGSIYCAVQFFAVTEVKDLMIYGGGFSASATLRCWSVSSIRSTNCPPCWRATDRQAGRSHLWTTLSLPENTGPRPSTRSWGTYATRWR